MDIIEKLNWRYATKRMTGRKVESRSIEKLLESIRLSPSSYGLQPYHVLVTEDKELKAQISSIAYNQPQVNEASHVLVFAAWKNTTSAQIEEFVEFIAAERGLNVSDLAQYQKMIVDSITARPAETNFHWAAKQAYLALGFALMTAAELGIDATPMEGFDNHALDKFLKLDQMGLQSTTLLCLGYRDDKSDYLVSQKKVRRPQSELITFLN